MANKTLNIRLRNKYDTEANWKDSNPVLLQGECAFTSDGNNKGRYKVGDGSTQWKNLSYATVPWSDIIGKPSTFTPTSHTHDDRYYTEEEINTKLKTKVDSTLSDLNAIQVKRNFTSAISPVATSITSSPFAKDLWHDHFAFLNTHTIESNQVSTDGKTWSDDALDLKPLFQGKESQSFTILTENIIARRFIIKSVNIAYSSINWIELGVSYSNPFSKFTISVEKSNDKSTWNEISAATISTSATSFFIACNSINNEQYLRFTLTKTTNLTNGNVNFSCIKALSNRKGNQGLGIEYEYPYDWDYNRNIYPHTNGDRNLGNSSKKWANVYANNFIGNASTATKLQTARTINGTSFDGSGNITTTNWGTARNITIGNSKKSVNGSTDISWSLSEIGASASNHTHNYAGSSSVAGAANSAVKLTTARTINGTNFDGSGNITTAKWGTSRDITIGNKKKPLDGSTAVAWTLAEIGASAIGHTHKKSEITDFPNSMKNPKGLRFLLPARDDFLYWHEDYENALHPGTDSDYVIGENDRINNHGFQGNQLVYDGSQYPIINLAKLYQAGGINYLTHTTSMKYIVDNHGLYPYSDNNMVPFPNDCNWNVFCVGYNLNYGYQEDQNIHYEAAKKNSGTGEASLYPSIIDDCLVAHAEFNRDSNSGNTFPKLIFYIDKSTFDDDGSSSCKLIYTFSFEIGDAASRNIISGQKIGVKIFDEYDYQDFDDFNDDTYPMYEEIWGINQTFQFYAGDKISVSFKAMFDRSDTQYHGIKIVFYGDEIELAIKHPQLERGNIPSDWRPALSEIVDGTYQSELESM